MGLARTTYNPLSKTVLHPILNPVQKRLVWLSVFCYLVLQGFVPAGYMPSFGLGSSSTPFVLCHGDNASAQWLNIQHKAWKDPVTVQQSLRYHAADILEGVAGSQELAQNTRSSENDSRPHSANLDCGFSSFYLSHVLESLAPDTVAYDTLTSIQAIVPHFTVTKKPSFQVQARAPPFYG